MAEPTRSSMERTLARWKRRAETAEAERDFANREIRCVEAWGLRECAENRRLAERCTFLYTKAIEHGATRDELADHPVIWAAVEKGTSE